MGAVRGFTCTEVLSEKLSCYACMHAERHISNPSHSLTVRMPALQTVRPCHAPNGEGTPVHCTLRPILKP